MCMTPFPLAFVLSARLSTCHIALLKNMLLFIVTHGEIVSFHFQATLNPCLYIFITKTKKKTLEP